LAGKCDILPLKRLGFWPFIRSTNHKSLLFSGFLAILPVDSQSRPISFPAVVLPDVDWANLIITIFFFIIWGAISYFVMRAVLFAFRWRTAGSNEEYSEFTKNAFVQSTSYVFFLGILLVTVSILKNIFGIV
jgi:hypothetical protein